MASEDEANTAAAAAEGAQEGKKWRKKGKHDKPKPWDEDPNIDRWKVEKFDPSWNEGGMLEVSSFSTLFPQYRGKDFHPIPLLPSRDSLETRRILSVLQVNWLLRSCLYCLGAEKYLQEAWPIVKGALKEFAITCELNLV
jgi:ribosomal RNA assembly protein